DSMYRQTGDRRQRRKRILKRLFGPLDRLDIISRRRFQSRPDKQVNDLLHALRLVAARLAGERDTVDGVLNLAIAEQAIADHGRPTDHITPAKARGDLLFLDHTILQRRDPTNLEVVNPR